MLSLQDLVFLLKGPLCWFYTWSLVYCNKDYCVCCSAGSYLKLKKQQPWICLPWRMQLQPLLDCDHGLVAPWTLVREYMNNRDTPWLCCVCVTRMGVFHEPLCCLGRWGARHDHVCGESWKAALAPSSPTCTHVPPIIIFYLQKSQLKATENE